MNSFGNGPDRLNAGPLMLWTTVVILLQLLLTGVALVIEPGLATRAASSTSDRPEAGGIPSIAMLLAFPVVTALAAMVLWIVLRFEPRQLHLGRSSEAVTAIVLSALMFLVLLHALVIGAVIGMDLSAGVVISVFVGALFVTVGLTVTRLQSNWAFGIRTPFTLTSETSWRRTQRLGRMLLVVGGVLIAAVGLASNGDLTGLAVAATVTVAAVTLVAYSYVEWRRDPNRRWFGS